MGIPLNLVWIPILIGLFIGAILPLRPFMRSKLHFTIIPNNKLLLEIDTDTLMKIIPRQKREKLLGFSHTLRKLGLTLSIK